MFNNKEVKVLRICKSILLKAMMTASCIFGTVRNIALVTKNLRLEIATGSEKCDKLQKCISFFCPCIAFSVTSMSPLLSVLIVFLIHFCTHLTFQWKSKHEELVCKSLRAARSHNRSHRISFFHFIFTRPLHTNLLDLLASKSHCLHFLGQLGQQLFALSWATQRGQQWSALSWATQLLL